MYACGCEIEMVVEIEKHREIYKKKINQIKKCIKNATKKMECQWQNDVCVYVVFDDCLIGECKWSRNCTKKSERKLRNLGSMLFGFGNYFVN